MALRTTVVGSWWPYPEEAEALARYHAGQLSAEEGRALLDRCASRAIQEQRDLGLTEWTGGEYFADRFILHLAKRLSGVEIDQLPKDDEFDYDDLGHVKITGTVDAPNGLGHVDAYERERELPGGVPKATVVSPLEMLVSVTSDQQAELDRQMPNLVAIVNREIRELAKAGCPHVQLDAPVLGVMVNEGAMTAQQAANVVTGCFEGVSGVTRGLHMCNGNNRGRPFSSVLRNAPWVPMLQRLDGVVDVANLEASYFSEYREREAFKDLPRSMELAAGIVDEANYWVEPVSKIKERAADWARVVGEDRMWLQLSCGFGRHAARDREILEPKITNMVEAATSF